MSTIQDFGIPNVGAGILAPKLKNKWAIQFTNLGGGVDSQPVSMQIVSCDRPKLNFDKGESNRYNSRVYYAGKYSIPPINLVLEDDIASTAAKAILAQEQAQQFISGAEGQFLASASESSKYKFSTTLSMLDGNDQVIENFVMEGCWFEAVDYGDADYNTTADAMQITLTMSIDLFRHNFFDYDGAGVGVGGAGS